MQILYIHGLDSSPNPERMACLEERGHQVIALHLDYRNTPESYQLLRNFAQAQAVDAIVGSSMGGMLGFWLGQELGVPCLLFNPAVYVSREEAHIPLDLPSNCPQRWVVIGAQDEVVDPQENWRFFENMRSPAPFQRVLLCQWLGHQIDLDTFAAMVRWTGW